MPPKPVERRIADLVARGIAAKVLSVLLSDPDPVTRDYLERRANTELDHAANLVGEGSAVRTDITNLRRVLPEVNAEALPALLGKAAAPPYETEYGMAHVFMKVQTMADVAGFYRAFGLDFAAGGRERPDHLAAEFEFLHFLLLMQASALVEGRRTEFLAVRRAETTFLREHLGAWGPAYLDKVATFDPDSAAARVAHVAARFVQTESRRLRVTARRALPVQNPQPAPETERELCEPKSPS
ncbi:MAG TPA: molecular chaperone TorD family protein [Thermoplasmata archaeon]|nr:molecular chaperone TorD family protein [Thermoplasmata archaeon]